MDEQDRGFGGGRAAVQELVFLQQRRRRQQEEEEVRRQMFGPVPVGGVAFPAAALGQQAVDCRELGGFCESEAGRSSEPEQMAPARPRGGSGSKRSRAAEVHNLSEKRRRSRINEKMKALQNLIPNSNKTDKASMLDEVIEYLKQLQLQMQSRACRRRSTLGRGRCGEAQGRGAGVHDDAAGHGAQGRDEPEEGGAVVPGGAAGRWVEGIMVVGGRVVGHRRERGPRPLQLHRVHGAHGDGQECRAQGDGCHVLPPVRRQRRRLSH